MVKIKKTENKKFEDMIPRRTKIYVSAQRLLCEWSQQTES